MPSEELRKLTEELIIKEKWSDFLKRFIDVLKINMFIVDYEGQAIIPPGQNGDRGRYGGEFLEKTFKFDLSGQKSNLIEGFKTSGSYLESVDSLNLHTFAIPVKADKGRIIAYMIAGPVILNKRDSTEFYIDRSQRLGLDYADFLGVIQEVRVVSFVSIKAILDLLSEVVRDIVQLNLEKKTLHQKRFDKNILPKEIVDAAKGLYSKIHLDELLITILDTALNLTQAECGSIMFLDEKSHKLSIKVSRGIDETFVRKARIKVGEGVAGMAADKNESFMISGVKAESRIKPFLKRPEIKQAAVIPLSAKDKVFGVLNIHTKKENGHIFETEEKLHNFSRLISAAITSL